MNQNIEKLYTIAQKETRLIIGLMSGTSLDGLDIALCAIRGSGNNTQLSILKYETLDYTTVFRDEIKSIFAQEQVYFKMVCAMNAKIAIAHAELINKTLKKWEISSDQIDLIASHGQTVFHAPKSSNVSSEYPNSTLQIGDGDHIAVLTNIITISDFRQKHVAAGGEGAPLVVYGDYLLFSPEEENRILLNIGGISNFTFLPAHHDTENLISTDVGPGNTMMNQYMRSNFDLAYDKDGENASQGKVNESLLEALIEHPFFHLPNPKTTGPEDFNLDFLEKAQKKSNTEDLSHPDVLKTLAALSVYGIQKAIKSIAQGKENVCIYVSGGGLNNPTLMKMLKQELSDFSVESTAVLGMPPDAKEAVLFALLANETVAGSPIQFPKSTGAPAVCMGKISFPN